MARHTSVNLPAGVWTQLTNADVTSITFQNMAGGDVFVCPTTSATAPTIYPPEVGQFSIRYQPGQGERNVLLSDLAGGQTMARVYAYSQNGATVAVSHA